MRYSNLEAELKRKSITRENLAKELDCSISTVSQKMTGKYDFTLAEAIKIKKLLNCSIDYLFEVAS